MSIKDASKKRPTIRDVAKVADVSVATVSRFLNGKTQKMSDQTAERIRVAIKKMNYVPNSAAREMARNSSRIIAVL
ncbi:LacI family DNA-binding transcriptional regulator, partial [Faecalibacillus intestinalis]|nr:LacI family DNA-binding transcriptional regulator [Faecalibacillus intestinalis]